MFTIAFAAAILNPSPTAPLPVASTVRIIHNRGTTAGIGSGTVVAHRGEHSTIVTAAHVCPSAGVKIIVTAGGVDYVGRWLGASAADDLAALEVDASLPVAPLATSPPAPGSPLRQVGYSGRWFLPFPREGATESTGPATFDNPPRTQLFAAIPVRFGDSGSGVFNVRGELVGVCSRGTLPPRVEVAVPVGEVVRFLDGLGVTR